MLGQAEAAVAKDDAPAQQRLTDDRRPPVLTREHAHVAGGAGSIYFFALRLSGFTAFERNPLRFLKLHAGYHGDGFLLEDRTAGIEPKRHIFVEIGVSFRELCFNTSRSRTGRAVGEVLDYFQPPYTAVHTHITD